MSDGFDKALPAELRALLSRFDALESAVRKQQDLLHSDEKLAAERAKTELLQQKDRSTLKGEMARLVADFDSLKESEIDELKQLKAELERRKSEKNERQKLREELSAKFAAKDLELEDDTSWEERTSDQRGRPISGYGRSLSIEQAFNFNRTRQEAFGYLSTLTIGGKPLTPGYVLDNPTGASLGKTNAKMSTQNRPGLRVVGVLESVSWDLGEEDPITFRARISASAKNSVMGVQFAAKASVEVQVSWVVFEYDQVARGYYVAFSTAASASGGPKLKGQIVKRSSTRALELKVGFEPASEVWTPQNFELEFQMRPKTGAPQNIYIGSSRLGRLFKKWGVAAK